MRAKNDKIASAGMWLTLLKLYFKSAGGFRKTRSLSFTLHSKQAAAMQEIHLSVIFLLSGTQNFSVNFYQSERHSASPGTPFCCLLSGKQVERTEDVMITPVPEEAGILSIHQ